MDGGDSVKSFQRRPTWLLHDINEMMLERNGKLLIPDNSSSHLLLTSRRSPDKSHLYKNYVREITPNFKPGEIYQLKLKKSKIDVLRAANSEKKITSFVEKLRSERQRQREQHEAFMRQALDTPATKQAFTERLPLSRPLSAAAGPAPLSQPNRLERPKTAPSHSPNKTTSTSSNNDNNNNQNKRRKKDSRKQSPELDRSPKRKQFPEPIALTPSNAEIQIKIQQRFLTLVKILQLLENCKRLHLYRQAETRGAVIFAKKIQHTFREMILRRQAYHKAVMPSIFMKYLKTYQKKAAVKKILTFLREFSTIHSHLIVKRFMICVRQAQVFIREMLGVKRARVHLLTLYWEKVEKHYRKQIEDQERETFARLQRERMARITSGSSSDVHGRWGMTHKQVVALFSHIETVDLRRANILRETGSNSRASRLRHSTTSSNLMTPTSTVLSDTVDPKYRQRIIEKYVSYKRGLHLKRGIPASSRAISPLIPSEEGGDSSQPFTDDALNIKLIKRFIHDHSLQDSHNTRIGLDEAGVRTNRELLERQLASAGVALEDDLGMGRKRKAAMRVFRKRPFLCLTDPSLGKPWKQIIEEVVREDIIRKKRILQEQNRKTFQDRVVEEQKRGIPIPTFTSSNGRRGTENASTVVLEMSTGETNHDQTKKERRDDEAYSSFSSPRSSYSVTSIRQRRAEKHLSISTSSPVLAGEHSRNKDESSPRFPSL